MTRMMNSRPRGAACRKRVGEMEAHLPYLNDKNTPHIRPKPTTESVGAEVRSNAKYLAKLLPNLVNEVMKEPPKKVPRARPGGHWTKYDQ